MRQGQAFALSALFLLCLAAASAAAQGNPRDPGGTATMAAPPSLPPADQGNPGDVGGPPPDQGNPRDVGGTGEAHETAGSDAAAHCTYRGTVASVDPTAKSFVVHPSKGDDVTLKVNDKTKYSPKGKGWDDVKANAKISGTCKEDGADNWAVTVRFWPEKASKAAGAKTGAR
jgi:hypothetical protein